jgi:glycosyltransferase involved in cell wall biosynthesis
LTTSRPRCTSSPTPTPKRRSGSRSTARSRPEKSLLVPTAEHDRAVYLRIFRESFRRTRAFAFNSPEERDLLKEISGKDALPGEVVGVGIEDTRTLEEGEVRKRLDLPQEYVIYVGRIEAAKGCNHLFANFLRFVQEGSTHLNLVLVGKAVLPVPNHVNILHLGVLSDTDKLSAIGASRLLIQPSPYESLSMVLLEAWKMGKPALVNGHCEVMRGQVRRAGGGLYYSSPEEFSLTLDYLLRERETADLMGRSGRQYFEGNYSWNVILEKYERLLALVKGK